MIKLVITGFQEGFDFETKSYKSVLSINKGEHEVSIDSKELKSLLAYASRTATPKQTQSETEAPTPYGEDEDTEQI